MSDGCGETNSCDGARRTVLVLVGGHLLGELERNVDRLALGFVARLQIAHASQSDQLGVVHGDVRSANVLIDRATRVQLIDFGFATIDNRESLIGMRRSPRDDLRMVATLVVAELCGLRYGSEQHDALLFAFRSSAEPWLWFKQSATDMAGSYWSHAEPIEPWQLALIEMAIRWQRSPNMPLEAMHNELLGPIDRWWPRCQCGNHGP